MPSINTIISNISNQNISLFFENKITSFKPEKDVFKNTFNEETPYSDPVKIGHAELKNHEELLVFTCQYNKELTARSAKKQQFEIAKKVLKEDFKDGAIFIFYDAQGNFRFSFIRRNYGQTGDKKFSTWKRYTYYVTPSETNRTFKERIDKCDYASLDSIQEAFSVEKLTKQFYNELFAWYQWALSDEIGITYPNNTKTSDDDRFKLEEQVIRLITRLLFVWFIKQKKLVPEYLFNTDELAKTLKDFDCTSLENGNYYNAILQNLFFATLNKEISEREFAKTKDRDIKTRFRYEEMFELSETEIIDYFKPIPFLNGGLFECLDKQDADGNNYFLDGFSRNPTKSANGNFRHRAFIPNCLFFDDEKGIIPLLRRYNFTVEENAPNEVQVALDPELLGKVFENLLGAFNPETKETARKQSGSFYTPREIVEYMVNESLINYLQTKLPTIDQEDLRDLFENETPKSTFLNDNKLCKDIADQLKAIKILDPACGSGAFPMGILSKMVEVLEKLGATNESIHDLKLHLIEECIYGIDIQTIATQISKLRFFITLVVEQDNIDLSKPDDNYGVLTLPNLETKFVSANTLIGIKKKKAGDFVNTLFTDSAIDDTKQELLNIRQEHFYAKTAGAKKRLREKDAELRDKLSKLLEENKDFAPEDALQLSQWNPYDQNTSSPFFDMEWMFGLHEGFDIVIGNPPYKDYREIESSIKTNSDLPICKSSNRPNLYQFFIELSDRLLNEKGSLSFINPSQFLSTDNGQGIREFLLRKRNIKFIIDVSYLNVFEAAATYTVVWLYDKNKSIKNNIRINRCLDLNNLTDISFYLNQEEIKSYNGMIIPLNKEFFQLVKIEKGLDTLQNISNLKWGTSASGYGRRKIKKEEYDELSTSQKKLYAPILQTSDTKKYFVSWQKEYIPKEIYSDSIIEQFKKKKIVIGRVTKKIQACIDEEFRFVGKATVLTDSNLDLKVVLGILNSAFANRWYYLKFETTHMAGGYLRFDIPYLKELPIPEMSKTQKQTLSKLVEEVISQKEQGVETVYLENQIDTFVYTLYKLNYDELMIIDPEFSLTQEEYDNYKI